MTNRGLPRRWKTSFFRPLTPHDAPTLDSIYSMLEFPAPSDEAAPMAWRLIERGQWMAVDYWTRDLLPCVRGVLNDHGLELSCGPEPHPNHRVRFVGRVIEGAPEMASELLEDGDWTILAASLFMEALPLNATSSEVKNAWQVLPPLPKHTRDHKMPLYHQPIQGKWAEWILDSRNSLAIMGLI